MKKVGRPKVTNPKNISIMVRVNKDTEQDLINYCKNNHITRAEAIRKSLALLMSKTDDK